MSKSDEKDMVQVAAGVATVMVAAAAVGAVAGMLLAPKKGSETRADIKRKVQEAKAKSQAKVEGVKDQAYDKADELKDRAQGAVDKVTHKAQSVADKAHDNVDDIAAETRARARARTNGTL